MATEVAAVSVDDVDIDLLIQQNEWLDLFSDNMYTKILNKHDLVSRYQSWNFDIWALRREELPLLSMCVMSKLDLPHRFNISMKTWINFMKRVEESMTVFSNPYHNYCHVVDVMHTCYLFIDTVSAADYLNSADALTLVVCGLVHDLDHPGTSNLYQVNKRTPLAVLYNDISVLENHHCAEAFNILHKHPDSNVFSGVEPTQWREIRKNMIALILSTDMSFHTSLMTDFQDLLTRCYETQYNMKTLLPDSDRMVLMKSILHASDVSNPTKVWNVAKKWGELVIEEFFKQGDLEKEGGLPISPGYDRAIAKLDETSVNFIDFIVAPLFLSFAPLLPKLTDAYANIKSNRSTWHGLLVTRLSDSTGDATVLQAALAPWEQKRVIFEETMALVAVNN